MIFRIFKSKDTGDALIPSREYLIESTKLAKESAVHFRKEIDLMDD